MRSERDCLFMFFRNGVEGGGPTGLTSTERAYEKLAYLRRHSDIGALVRRIKFLESANIPAFHPVFWHPPRGWHHPCTRGVRNLA